jgi:hypothetical protein
MSFRSALAPLRQAVRASASSSRAAPVSARAISSTSARRSESLFVHRDTDYNNPNVSNTSLSAGAIRQLNTEGQARMRSQQLTYRSHSSLTRKT